MDPGQAQRFVGPDLGPNCLPRLSADDTSRYCRLLIFFQNQLFRKILSGIPSECQLVWIQISPDILSGLICVQTDCKEFQQTTLAGKELIIDSVPGLATEIVLFRSIGRALT